MPLAAHVAITRSFACYFSNINEDNKKDIPSEEFITVISAYLGKQLERYVAQLVATGRYGSKSEVLREGVRLVHEREVQRSTSDVATQSGLCDANAGRGDSAEASSDQSQANDSER
ncbi:type II toxin-antitoxin system ParD family antitoxin [Burkholderia alba]|uniref:type II toxin-antitoxin system ParD family antitoxin n=1 Tax=Burkholderia alba TaxID=2683677 RepID=UPI002B052A53|nr:type II toxin-antitoxin system ParD family antitoxin [Burkholderia alba]